VSPSTGHALKREQAEAYALAVLEGDERADFEAHLLVCAECSAAVRSLEAVAAALAYSAPQVDPPPAVRERVIGSVQGSGVSQETLVGREPSRNIARAPRGWLPFLAAAACLIAAVGLGLYSVTERRHVIALEQLVRDATQRAETANRQRDEVTQRATENQAVVIVLNASDLVRVDLAGQPVAPRAAARAFWSRTRGLVFTASSLPPLPAGRTYQLWVVTAAAPIGAGVLKPGVDGDAHGVFMTPSDLAKPVAIALTIEPEGGVPAPTGDKYLVGLVN